MIRHEQLQPIACLTWRDHQCATIDALVQPQAQWTNFLFFQIENLNPNENGKGVYPPSDRVFSYGFSYALLILLLMVPGQTNV